MSKAIDKIMEVLKKNYVGGIIGGGLVYLMLPAGAALVPVVSSLPAVPGAVTYVYAMVPGGATVAMVVTVALGYIAGAYIQKAATDN